MQDTYDDKDTAESEEDTRNRPGHTRQRARQNDVVQSQETLRFEESVKDGNSVKCLQPTASTSLATRTAHEAPRSNQNVKEA